MKHTRPCVLQLRRETVRVLTATKLADIQGGQRPHNSFSCGNNLCTTHPPTGG